MDDYIVEQESPRHPVHAVGQSSLSFALTRFIPASEVSIHKGGRRGLGSHGYLWPRQPRLWVPELFHSAGPGQKDVLAAW